MLAFTCLGNTLILVHSTRGPTPAAWDSWIQRMAQRDYSSILILTDGGHPNAAQRAQATQFWSARSWPKFAFVTGSVGVRAALSAFKWIGFTRYRVFALDQLTDALRSLDVPEGELADTRQAVTRLRAEIAGSPDHLLASSG